MPSDRDKNPIELAFTRIKAQLRASKLRTIDIDDDFTTHECRNDIWLAGYTDAMDQRKSPCRPAKGFPCRPKPQAGGIFRLSFVAHLPRKALGRPLWHGRCSRNLPTLQTTG